MLVYCRRCRYAFSPLLSCGTARVSHKGENYFSNGYTPGCMTNVFEAFLKPVPPYSEYCNVNGDLQPAKIKNTNVSWAKLRSLLMLLHQNVSSRFRIDCCYWLPLLDNSFRLGWVPLHVPTWSLHTYRYVYQTTLRMSTWSSIDMFRLQVAVNMIFVSLRTFG